jgi:sulfotransferase
MAKFLTADRATMDAQFQFVSGLPRSGSTLLCALLRQNPRFAAAVTSPVFLLFTSTIAKMSGGSEFSTFFDERRRSAILRGIINGYYDNERAPIVFDTNRAWTSHAAILQKLFPTSRIICCVRDVGRIIDSVERQLRKNPLEYSRTFNFKPGASVYARAELLMNLENGLLGSAFSGLRQAWFSDEAKSLIVIEYEKLCEEPERVLRKLYQELGEAWFAHDFNNLDYDEPEYDRQLGMPGLHKIRPVVSHKEHKLVIPPDLYEKHSKLSFWKQSDAARAGITVI